MKLYSLGHVYRNYVYYQIFIWIMIIILKFLMWGIINKYSNCYRKEKTKNAVSATSVKAKHDAILGRHGANLVYSGKNISAGNYIFTCEYEQRISVTWNMKIFYL